VDAVTQRTIRREARAKINVFLRVLSTREDGYHEIESLVVPISLADRVVVRPAEELRVEIAGEPAFSPGGLNLSLVAALALADACGDAAGALGVSAAGAPTRPPRCSRSTSCGGARSIPQRWRRSASGSVRTSPRCCPAGPS
jgi:hypothetical protein